MIAGGYNGYLTSTEVFNLESKTIISGGDLQSAREVTLVTVGSGSQLRTLAFGMALVEEWMEDMSAWREAGRLQKRRGSGSMGAVAVPEVLVCQALGQTGSFSVLIIHKFRFCYIYLSRIFINASCILKRKVKKKVIHCHCIHQTYTTSAKSEVILFVVLLLFN